MSDDTLIYVYGLWPHGPPGCPEWIENSVVIAASRLVGRTLPVKDVLNAIDSALPDGSIVRAEELAGKPDLLKGTLDDKHPGMITASFGRQVQLPPDRTLPCREFNWRVFWFHVKQQEAGATP